MMEALDRTKAPAYNALERIAIQKAERRALKNGIPVYTINAGEQALVKIEFIFEAGTVYQQKPLLAATVNTLIDAGTSKYSANQIAEEIDYYGAYLEAGSDKDDASVTLYSLNKHLEKLLPFFREILLDAVFPEEELLIYLQNKKQRFVVNQEKVDHVARKEFSQIIFGNKHSYGYPIKLEDYDQVNRKDVLDFYQKHYRSNTAMIIISGKVEPQLFNLIDKLFGESDWSGEKEKQLHVPESFFAADKKIHLIEKEAALQSAIRMGLPLFNKVHEEHAAMQVLNTVLGGYFGSRLMSNIREDKGYTYGIGSRIVSLKQSGYFFISTEVGVDVCAQAVDEIYSELQRLNDELIPDKELQLVKNYMLGAVLKSIDGPFSLADRLKSLITFGLDYDHFLKMVDTIKNVSAKELRELSNKYLRKEMIFELVVGKK